ncbi:MAG: hypothetical protein FWC21_06665 [Treponema sp.]|nr:hypothetical protein [Treponema sp.]
MNTEVAMLISAGIAGLISISIVFLTRFFDARSEKRRDRENFFYAIFPKRLELYEDIIKVTHFIATPILIIECESIQEMSDLFMNRSNIIADTLYRCNTYASIQVTAKLALIHKLIDDFAKNTCNEYDLPAIKYTYEKLFMPNALVIRGELIKFIRKESGAELVDKKIDDFIWEIKKTEKDIQKKGKKNTRSSKS